MLKEEHFFLLTRLWEKAKLLLHPTKAGWRDNIKAK